MSESKKCNVCDETKSLNDFHNNKRTKDGLSYTCKDCARIQVREYKQQNRKKTSRQQNEYLKRNSDNPIFNDIYKEKARLTSIMNAIRRGATTTKTSMNRIGCDLETFKRHLQQTAIDNGYDDFDIETYNRNEYHIDHIISFKKALDGEYTLDDVCNYKNIQILRAEDNFFKHIK